LRIAFGPRNPLLIPLLYLSRPWTYAWAELKWRVASRVRPPGSGSAAASSPDPRRD
jgi:hypothetical protein